MYGCGAIGLCVVGCLRAVGCESKIIAIAKYPFQAEKAKEGGADVVLHSSGKELFKEIADHVGGRVVRTRFGNNRFLIGGADVVFDCVGTSETLTNAMKFCRENGTVILAGMAYPGKIDWSSLYFKELDIRGTISSGLEDFEHRKVSAMDLIYDLILEGKLRLAPLITHRFEIGEYRQAFDTILHKKRTGEIKTLFYVDSPSA